MTAPQADSNSLPADGEVAQYRAVSLWAVAALVLGLLSPVAFVGPVLWLIPLSCLACALVAFAKIAASGGELVGWNMALLGVLMALLFGIAAPVHTLTRLYWLETRAESFANEFIDLLRQGRPEAAFQLTLLPTARKPLDADLSAEIDKDSKSKEKYDHFLQVEPAPTLLAQRDKARVEKLETQLVSSDEESDRLTVRYQISPAENGSPLVLQFRLQRYVDDKTGREMWRIESSDLVRQNQM